MAIQLSTAVRNARIAAIETTVGSGPLLQIRSGPPPASPAAADAGALLAEITLPSDWLTAPAGGAASLIGTPGVAALAGGTAGHYRLKDSSGATCHEQGTVTATLGGGDMTVDNVSVGIGQPVILTGYTRIDGNV